MMAPVVSKFEGTPAAFAVSNDYVAIAGRDLLDIFRISETDGLIPHLNLRAGVKLNSKYNTTDIKWARKLYYC